MNLSACRFGGYLQEFAGSVKGRKTNVLVLAAGYGVRLHPITIDKPKPLIEVAGRPAMDWVLEAFDHIPNRGKVVAVTNSKFSALYHQWAEGKDVEVIENGSMCPEDKLGAIGDLALSLERSDLYGADLLVLGGDTLFTLPQKMFMKAAEGRDAVIGTYDVGCLEEVKRFASVEVDSEGKLDSLIEKPENPTSTVAGSMVYYFSAETLPKIDEYLAEGNTPDPAGKFMQWLLERMPIYGVPLEGEYHDIGCHESLARANDAFACV